MNRRHMIFTAVTLVPGFAVAAEKPWALAILQGAFDGKKYDSGVLLQLKPGWKTYWRVPGAGGVPPSITVTGDNVKAFTFDCPLPRRLTGAEGENIGYHEAVGFPVTITPVDPARPVNAAINVFAGVCETICIPVQVNTNVVFDPAQPGADQQQLQQWQMKVPQLSDIVSAATYDAGTNELTLTTSHDVSDVFIECEVLPLLFNDAPTPGNVVKIKGLKAGQSLVGQTCRLTMATPFGGLEQILAVG
jgi:DsbC/DsbD-like thiol-disulfide interchange protein